MENYPYKTVCLSFSLTFFSYFLGFLVLFALNAILGIFYLALCLLTTLISLKLRCTYCYYYGKRCSNGNGILCEKIFKQGDPVNFSDLKNVGITSIFSFGTMLLPIICGIILLINTPTLPNILLYVANFIIAIIPNFFIRKNTCERCIQGEIGCPAYESMKKKIEKDEKK